LTQELPSGARVRPAFRGMSTARHDALSVSLAAAGRSSRVQRLQVCYPKRNLWLEPLVIASRGIVDYLGSPLTTLAPECQVITPEPGLPDKVLSEIHQTPCNRSGRLHLPCSAQLQSPERL
jgi:hypothetical protein